MKLKVEIPPETRATFVALRDLGEDIKLGLRDAVEESLTEVRSAALASLERAKHGTVYRRRRGGGEYRASMPGEPPATDTGGLAATIKQKVFRDQVSGAVYTAEPLGFWLESGALHRLRGGRPNPMLPRPWLARARDENFEHFVARVVSKLDGVIDRFNSGGGA